MSIKTALDPLKLRAAPSTRTSIDTATAVLAPLLGIDAESPEQQLQALLLDRGSLLGTQPAVDASRSSRSAAVAFAGTGRPRQSIEADLAAQRDREWRVALAGGNGEARGRHA